MNLTHVERAADGARKADLDAYLAEKDAEDARDERIEELAGDVYESVKRGSAEHNFGLVMAGLTEQQSRRLDALLGLFLTLDGGESVRNVLLACLREFAHTYARREAVDEYRKEEQHAADCHAENLADAQDEDRWFDLGGVA